MPTATGSRRAPRKEACGARPSAPPHVVWCRVILAVSRSPPLLFGAVADLVALRRSKAQASAALLVREAEGVGLGVELARLHLIHARRAVVGLLPLAGLRHDGQAVALDAVGAGDGVEERRRAVVHRRLEVAVILEAAARQELVLHRRPAPRARRAGDGVLVADHPQLRRAPRPEHGRRIAPRRGPLTLRGGLVLR